jgi:hypothetical protein
VQGGITSATLNAVFLNVNWRFKAPVRLEGRSSRLLRFADFDGVVRVLVLRLQSPRLTSVESRGFRRQSPATVATLSRAVKRRTPYLMRGISATRYHLNTLCVLERSGFPDVVSACHEKRLDRTMPRLRAAGHPQFQRRSNRIVHAAFTNSHARFAPRYCTHATASG